MKRSLALIGSGNVATWFAWKAAKSGWEISQVFSRKLEHATRLAHLYDAEPIDDISLLKTDNDLYLFSVNDDSYLPLLEQLPRPLPLAVHTGGSVSQDIFKGRALRYGVIYPFQSISREVDFEELTVPLCVEAQDKSTENELRQWASEWSDVLYLINGEQRRWLHLAAVFTSNFSNALCHIGFQFLDNQNIDYKILFPLLRNTIDKLEMLSPHEAQTGPAVRNDKEVMNKHLGMIEDEKVRELYQKLSEFIIMSRNK